jgi:hypothetical protein
MQVIDLAFGVGWIAFPDTYPEYKNCTKMPIPYIF